MRLYLYSATLQAFSTLALKFLHIRCSELGASALDIDEIDNRQEIDFFMWMTLIESVFMLIMINRKYRTYCVYVITFFLSIRLHDKGIFNTCMQAKQCPKESETVFDYDDVCGSDRTDNFSNKHFWSNSYNLCNVPEYYKDCRNRPVHNKTSFTQLDPSIQLKLIPNLYQCYAWGCSYEITPVRFCLKWFTTFLACVVLTKAGSDFTKNHRKQD